MTLLATLLAATLAVSAADRLAMADRQFRRGEYAAAMREYTALRGSELLASDVSFRILLTAHMLGDKAAVLKEGAAFLALEPTGEKADRARLMVAQSDAPEKAAVALRALDRDDVARILDLELAKLRARLSERDMTLELDKKAVDFLCTKGADDALGARPLRRAVQHWVEDPLADLLLRETFGPGRIRATVEKDGSALVFRQPKKER